MCQYLKKRETSSTVKPKHAYLWDMISVLRHIDFTNLSARKYLSRRTLYLTRAALATTNLHYDHRPLNTTLLLQQLNPVMDLQSRPPWTMPRQLLSLTTLKLVDMIMTCPPKIHINGQAPLRPQQQTNKRASHPINLIKTPFQKNATPRESVDLPFN